MSTFYQVGPLFEQFYHLYNTGLLSATNEQGAQFRPSVDYDNARIPDVVPYADNSNETNPAYRADNVMRPSGFRKGDRYTRPSSSSSTFFDTSTTNPFIIGWGYRIGDAFWVEIDLPFDWSLKNYPGAFAQLDGKWDSQRKVSTGEHNPDGSPAFHRVFVWCISLQFVVHDGVVPPQLPKIPPKPIEARVPTQTFTAGTILYSKGARRIELTPIWIKGVEAGDADIGETAIGTWAGSAGYPLHPGEEIYHNQIWFDGGEPVYTDADGIDTERLGEDAEITLYQGTEDQEPDPDIVEDKGEARTPAFLGQIYLVFKNVQLAAFGNRLPAVSVEFRPVDEQRITVAEALEDIGVLGGVDVVIEGIDDEADGVVFDGMDPRGLLEKYKEIYGYRIVDGNPVRIVRRAVNDDLVVDYELDVTDFADSSAEDPVTILEREDDSTLPNQITLNYTDKSQNYQRRPQYARLPKFPVAATIAKKNKEIDTDFAITAAEDVMLAHDILYRIWSEKLGAEFKLIPARGELEEADVIRVPTTQGQWLMQIERRTREADNGIGIKSLYLLAERGATLSADAGDLSSGVTRACYYPQMLVGSPPMVITGDRIWSWAQCEGEDDYVLAAASTNVPTKLSKRYEAAYPFDDASQPGTDVVFDEDYVYSVHQFATISTSPTVYSGPRIMRVNKALPTEVTSLICPDLRTGGEDLQSLTVTGQCAVLNGFLYIVTAGYSFTFGPSSGPMRLWIINLSAFDEDHVTVVELETPAADHIIECTGMCAAGGKILISTRTLSSGGGVLLETEIFSYYPPDETVTQDTTAYQLGRACGDIGFGFFLPDTSAGFLENVQGAKVSPSTMDVEYFDITEDPNVLVSADGNRPWSDGTSLNFIVNNVEALLINAPFLAKRSLADLSVGADRDLTFDHDNLSYRLYAGASDGTYSYLKGSASFAVRHGPGCILKVDNGLAYGVFYPARQAPPANDDFPGSAIKLSQTKTFYNEFATKQEGEPDHNDDPGGKSLWWTFTAAVDGFYRASISNASANIAVYLGDTLATISEVGSTDELTGFVEFAATAGQKVRVAIDGHFDPDSLVVSFGEGTIAVTQVPTPPNDDFANAALISPGQTKTARNRFATKEVGEPDHAGNAGGKSLWWKYTPSADTNLRVNTTGSDFPTLLAVYVEGSPAGVGGLVEIDSVAEAGGTDDDYARWMTAL